MIDQDAFYYELTVVSNSRQQVQVHENCTIMKY
jgi:hypothetical protein